MGFLKMSSSIFRQGDWISIINLFTVILLERKKLLHMDESTVYVYLEGLSVGVYKHLAQQLPEEKVHQNEAVTSNWEINPHRGGLQNCRTPAWQGSDAGLQSPVRLQALKIGCLFWGETKEFRCPETSSRHPWDKKSCSSHTIVGVQMLFILSI